LLLLLLLLLLFGSERRVQRVSQSTRREGKAIQDNTTTDAALLVCPLKTQ
jgi:hypothetical protein